MGSLNLESCYESFLESDRAFSKVGMTKGKGGSPIEYPPLGGNEELYGDGKQYIVISFSKMVFSCSSR
jgi:hypothetical protein